MYDLALMNTFIVHLLNIDNWPTLYGINFMGCHMLQVYTAKVFSFQLYGVSHALVLADFPPQGVVLNHPGVAKPPPRCLVVAEPPLKPNQGRLIYPQNPDRGGCATLRLLGMVQPPPLNIYIF